MKRFLVICLLFTSVLGAEDFLTLYRRGHEAMVRKEYKKAVSLFTESLESMKKKYHYIVYNDRGIAYRRLKMPGKAMSDFLKAIRLQPRFSPPYSNMGTLYIDRKEYNEAMELFKQAYEYDPRNFIPLYNIACVHSLEKRKPEAVRYLEKTVNLLVSQGRSLQRLYQMIIADSDFNNIRSYPPFEKLMMKMKKSLKMQQI